MSLPSMTNGVHNGDRSRFVLFVIWLRVLGVVVDWPTSAAARATEISDIPTTITTHRQIVSFDFGWKHRAGLHDWPNDPYQPAINTTAVGVTYIDPGPHPKEASVEYVPCDWIDTKLPHDGIISNPFGNAPSLKACPDGCSGKSYIPRHVLWYRKQFMLPTSRSTTSNDNDTHSWQDELLDGSSKIYLRFDGSFRNTTVYIDGNRIFQHECGYTPFRIELTPQNLGLIRDWDNNIPVSTSSNSIHTIAIFVDPNNGDGGGSSRGSGWWYEGGGLYRRSWLEKIPRVARISHDGVFVKSQVSFDRSEPFHVRSASASSIATVAVEASMELRATFEIEDWDDQYCYGFTVRETNNDLRENKDSYDEDARILKSAMKHLVFLSEDKSGHENDNFDSSSSNTIITVTESLQVTNPRLWTSSHSHLYEVTAHLYIGCGNHKNEGNDAGNGGSGMLLDEITVHHGIRSTRFDPNTGFYWNESPYKIRGFCDHDTFAVVGMAIPDRINLFRAQLSRSIGGNARRASHNPPDPATLEIYDRLGMVVIDENRLFANNSRYVQNMADLIKRDRNHPSVIIWSFCNEVDCEGDHETGGPPFQAVASALDGSRPTLANMFTFHDLLSDTIDVQGFSHRHRDTLKKCHLELPDKPIVQSECCSCNTMRDVDEGCETTSDNPKTTCDQKSFNARCLETLVNASDGTAYASGTFVWTLLDYYGEPPSRPLTVSSTYGQFDLCGFPKASAFWFRSQWLLTQPHEFLSESPLSTSMDTGRRLNRNLGFSGSPFLRDSVAVVNGRPFETNGMVEVHIVESWESPDRWNVTKGNTTRTIHVYSNAPVVELWVIGNDEKKPRSLGNRTLVPMVSGDGGSYGEWKNIPWKPGSLIASAKSHNGTMLAWSRRHTLPTIPKHSIVLSLDCPSPATGTGSALFLDGSDVALVRATVVESNSNQRLLFAGNPIEFRVMEGPGKILGTANGDPKSKASHTNTTHHAHHGLVRAVVGLTSIAGLAAVEKELLSSMEVGDNDNDTILGYSSNDDKDIVIEARSPGLEPTRLTIPTSTDRRLDSVLAVSARGAGQSVDLKMG